jgi:hypothetical protein
MFVLNFTIAVWTQALGFWLQMLVVPMNLDAINSSKLMTSLLHHAVSINVSLTLRTFRNMLLGSHIIPVDVCCPKIVMGICIKDRRPSRKTHHAPSHIAPRTQSVRQSQTALASR